MLDNHDFVMHISKSKEETSIKAGGSPTFKNSFMEPVINGRYENLLNKSYTIFLSLIHYSFEVAEVYLSILFD
jgi:hypothetical protein